MLVVVVVVGVFQGRLDHACDRSCRRGGPKQVESTRKCEAGSKGGGLFVCKLNKKKEKERDSCGD